MNQLGFCGLCIDRQPAIPSSTATLLTGCHNQELPRRSMRDSTANSLSGSDLLAHISFAYTQYITSSLVPHGFLKRLVYPGKPGKAI